MRRRDTSNAEPSSSLYCSCHLVRGSMSITTQMPASRDLHQELQIGVHDETRTEAQKQCSADRLCACPQNIIQTAPSRSPYCICQLGCSNMSNDPCGWHSSSRHVHLDHGVGVHAKRMVQVKISACIYVVNNKKYERCPVAHTT
jgi:hypothetical protein